MADQTLDLTKFSDADLAQITGAKTAADLPATAPATPVAGAMSRFSDADLQRIMSAKSLGDLSDPTAGMSDGERTAYQAGQQRFQTQGAPASDYLVRGLPFTSDLSALAYSATKAVKNVIDGHNVAFGQLFSEGKAEDRGFEDARHAAHPILAPLGALAGGLLLGGAPALRATAVAAPALTAAEAPTLLDGVRVGAGMGAAQGFGDGTDMSDRLTRAAFGGTLGAAGAAAVPAVAAAGGRGVNYVRGALGLGDAGEAATAQLLRTLERDRLTPGDLGAAHTMSGDAFPGQPTRLVDLGGENMQRLGRATAQEPGPAQGAFLEGTAARQADIRGGIADDLSAALGNTGVDYRGTFEAMDQAKRAAAAPAYEAAYSAPPMNPDAVAPGGDLATLLERPSMRGALGRAYRIAAEEGRNPASLGLGLDAEGNVALQGVPSWQTVDYVKRGVDDVLNARRNPITGRLNLDEEGRAIVGSQNALRSFISENNPALTAAYRTWAGPTQSQQAMQAGRDLFSSGRNAFGEELTAQRIRDLAPGDREFFRLGMRQGIQDFMDNQVHGRNVAQAITASPALEAKIRAAFDNPAAFQRFMGQVRNRAEQFRADAFMSPRTGSQTTLRQMDAADLNHSPLPAVAEGLASAAHGNAFGMLSAAGRIFGGADRMTTRKAAELGPMLFSSDPAQVRAAIDELSRSYAEREAAVRASRQLRHNVSGGASMGLIGALQNTQ